MKENLATINTEENFFIKKIKIYLEMKRHYEKTTFGKLFDKIERDLIHRNLDDLKIITKKDNQDNKEITGIIGEEGIAKSDIDALEMLASTMIDDFEDGNSNVVFYIGEYNEIYFLESVWCDVRSKWFCYKNHANKKFLSENARVFY